MTKDIGKIKQKVVKILKENGVKRAGIFGSYARGEQTKNSYCNSCVNSTELNNYIQRYYLGNADIVNATLAIVVRLNNPGCAWEWKWRFKYREY